MGSEWARMGGREPGWGVNPSNIHPRKEGPPLPPLELELSPKGRRWHGAGHVGQKLLD